MLMEANLFKHDTLWAINDNIYSIVNLSGSRGQILDHSLKPNCETGSKWKSCVDDVWQYEAYPREDAGKLSEP